MITVVLDENNRVIHDCAVEGCSVSWDGFALRDIPAAELYEHVPNPPANPQAVPFGSRVPNAANPDPLVWDVLGKTAKRRKAATG